MLERLKRGEIWPLPVDGTSEEIVAVAREMRMDFCFFDRLPGASDLAKAVGLATGAVLNGPLQRWMVEVGWEEALRQLGRGTDRIRQELEQKTFQVRREIAEWLATGVDMILLADDVAYSGGPYMSPEMLGKYLIPCYSILSNDVRTAGKIAGFHTDGRVDLILPALQQADFQFYSLEPEGTDPIRVWHLLGSLTPLLSGLPAAWLSAGGFLPHREGKILRQWLAAGPLTVTSACGLYHEGAKEALSEIYQWLDQNNIG